MRVLPRWVPSSERALRIAVAVLAVAGVATECDLRAWTPDDPVTHYDFLDRFTLQIAEAAPRWPIVLVGPDGLRDTADDVVVPGFRGDIDLVVRAGPQAQAGPIPASPSNLLASPAANGLGSEIDFVVRGVAGYEISPLVWPASSSESLEGRPILVLAFADLDGDGRIGPTARDGIPLIDVESESFELLPVGMQLVEGADARGTGRIRILAGAPAAHPLRVVLTALTLTGPTSSSFLGGVVPTGPALMTALPFIPPADRTEAFDAGPNGPESPSPNRPLGIRIEAAALPEPSDPNWQDVLDLAIDGAEQSIDTVQSVAGPATHFGLARSASDPGYTELPRRPVRLGIDERGMPQAYEVADRVHVADDGDASVVTARIVPLDRLGSITDLARPESVIITTDATVAIRTPDLDGDVHRETIFVMSAAGTPIELDDAGIAHDDPLADTLIVTSTASASRVDLVLPDPDVDESGRVDRADADAVHDRIGLRIGDLVFEDRHDVDGNGRIEQNDERIVRDFLGETISAP